MCEDRYAASYAAFTKTVDGPGSLFRYIKLYFFLRCDGSSLSCM